MLIGHFRKVAADALDRRFAKLDGDLNERFTTQLSAIQALLEDERKLRIEAETELRVAVDALERHVTGDMMDVLRAIASEEIANRRALTAIRQDPLYELPFTEPEPLVSICITVIAERLQLLMERALPSALAQSYPNIEVVVVGDMVGPEIPEAIAALGDDRVRFFERTQPVKYLDPYKHWLASGAMARNEAHRQARGLWIADLDDDDALAPDAVESLLALAKQERVEVAYGVQRQHEPGGGETLLGSFPPRPTDPDWREQGLAYQPWEGYSTNAALNHHAMRYFGRELVSASLNLPNDYFRLEKLVRAGARFAMLDQVVYEYWPSNLWGAGQGLTQHPLLDGSAAAEVPLARQ
jgi:hypothetical protein